MRRSRRWLVVATLVALAGCGRKADPLPPIVEVPETTTDLSVYQEQLDAVLTWSFPTLTRAGRTLTDLGRVEVWRLDVPPGQESTGTGTQAEELRRQLMVGRGRLIGRLEGDRLHEATRGSKLEFRDALTAVTPGSVPTTLWYAVRTRRRDGTASALSNIVVWKPQPVPPSVTGTVATPGPGGIELSWQGVPGGTYAVERRDAAGGPWQIVSPIGFEATTWVDRQVEQGKTWQYRVRTVIQATASPRVGEITVPYPDAYPPPLPTSFLCLPEESVVRLRWDQPAETGVTFAVSRRVDGGAWTPLGTPQSATEVRDSEAPGGAVEYQVRAVDPAGNTSEPVTCSVRIGP